MVVRVRVRGARRLSSVAAGLDRVATGSDREVRRYLRRAARIARDGYRAQFATSGRAFRQRWPALAASTRKRRGGRGARRPLIGKGRLLRSVIGAGARQSRGRLKLEATTRSADGRSLIRLHEMGGPNLPIRRIRHPKTGVGGGTLRELEREWERSTTRLVRQLERI